MRVAGAAAAACATMVPPSPPPWPCPLVASGHSWRSEVGSGRRRWPDRGLVPRAAGRGGRARGAGSAGSRGDPLCSRGLRGRHRSTSKSRMHSTTLRLTATNSPARGKEELLRSAATRSRSQNGGGTTRGIPRALYALLALRTRFRLVAGSRWLAWYDGGFAARVHCVPVAAEGEHSGKLEGKILVQGANTARVLPPSTCQLRNSETTDWRSGSGGGRGSGEPPSTTPTTPVAAAAPSHLGRRGRVRKRDEQSFVSRHIHSKSKSPPLG